MAKFAWRNLLTRPLRTVLALIGLSVPIVGILGLFCLSDGLRNLVGATLSRVRGLIVVREDAPTPVFSRVPAGLAGELRKIPHVRAVAPEIWGLAPTIEGRGMLLKSVLSGKGMSAILDKPVIDGQDVIAHQDVRSVFPRCAQGEWCGSVSRAGRSRQAKCRDQ